MAGKLRRERGWPEQVGPLAHRQAFSYLCQLVRGHDYFAQSRRRLRRRYPWLRSVEFEPLARQIWTYRRGDPEAVLRLGLASSEASAADVESFMAELLRLIARYGFDRIHLGPLFMIQLLASQRVDVSVFGDDPHGFIFTEKFFISVEDTQGSFLKRATRQLVAVWEAMEGHERSHRTSREWAEKLSVKVLHERVGWYFRRRVLDEPLWRVADDAGYSEYTVRLGVSQIERLLGMRSRRGRPTTKSVASNWSETLRFS